MKVELPKDVLGELPAPDSQGLVRVTAGLRIGEGGSVELVEINDQPLPAGSDEGNEEISEDDLMTSLDAAEDDIYG